MISGWTFVWMSVSPSVFCFRMMTWVNINGFFRNLICLSILWRSDLGLLKMAKFHQILMELSAWDTPIFLFPDNNLSKCRGILTKLGTCFDIKEILFGIANGHISSGFDSVTCRDTIMMVSYPFIFLLLLQLLFCRIWSGPTLFATHPAVFRYINR